MALYQKIFVIRIAIGVESFLVLWKSTILGATALDHFLKGLHDFCAYFHEVYFHGVF